MPWLHQKRTAEPETNVSVPKKGGQADTTSCKGVADYDQDVDYEPKGSNPDSKAVDQEE